MSVSAARPWQVVAIRKGQGSPGKGRRSRLERDGTPVRPPEPIIIRYSVTGPKGHACSDMVLLRDHYRATSM